MSSKVAANGLQLLAVGLSEHQLSLTYQSLFKDTQVF